MVETVGKIELTHCPACAYSLTGLPTDWRCPECGFEYDANTFVLEGISRGTSSMTSSRKWLWILLAIGGTLGPSFLIPLLFEGFAPVALILCAAWVALLIYLLMTGKRERRGLEQILFAAGGFGYCTSGADTATEGFSLVRWADVDGIRIDRKGSRFHRLRINSFRLDGRPGGRTELDVGLSCDEDTARWLNDNLSERIQTARSSDRREG